MRTAISDQQSAISIQQSACSVGAGPVLRTPAVSGSMGLTTGFDTPVLSLVEGLRMNGWGVEGVGLS